MKTLRMTTFILSTSLAISGMHHGFFEILQGSTPTHGVFIESIGEAHRMWENGNDPAVTLIPNFLWTGITAMFFGLLIIWWSASKLPSPRSADTLLLLFSGLTLAGGGVGYIPFFLMVWIYSRKHGSLEIWIRRIVPERQRLLLSRAWLPATLLSSLFFLLGLEISVFGYVPGTKDPERILQVCWGCLLISFILIHPAYLGAASTAVNERTAANEWNYLLKTHSVLPER